MTNSIKRLFSTMLLALAAVSTACKTPAPSLRYQPYESVVQILADFKIHRDDDLYRFGYPRDISGQNLFRATLKRIDNYKTLYPTKFQDILAVAEGQLLERMANYSAAIKAYSELGPQPSEEMAAAAEQSLGYLRELVAIAHRPGDASTLPRFLSDLELKRDELMDLADKFTGTHYSFLARMEAEKVGLQRILLLFHNRYVLPGGLEKPLDEMAEFIETHAESHYAARHLLLLGDFHFAALKDYATLYSPEQMEFSAANFDSLSVGARQAYFAISQKDGAAERPEARAKLQALEAFIRTTNDLAK